MWYRIALLFATALAPVHAATLYKWVDENGTLHFSDQPHPGAEVIELEEAQTFDAPAVPELPAAGENDDGDSAFRYDSLVIEAPREGQTLWNTGGNVNVALALVPRLRPGDELRVFYDGNPVERPEGGLSFMLTDVFRGTHTLRATAVDSEDNVLAESSLVTFYVHQTSIVTPGS
ncbi:MAG: DUF4124 domain-containing protein [Gammaproteobacteria bacterium]|nr:DUF4124 domain-containing protein [Gammaproteobacteria bacterium]